MPEVKLARYMSATIVQSLPGCRAEVEEAFSLIARNLDANDNGSALQLLALRRYLRMSANDQGKTLLANWAWTPEQAKQLSQVGRAKVLMDEAKTVQRRFVERNPGSSLGISPLRSLQSQVQKWNDNNTVQAAGTGLLKKVMSELTGPKYPDVPSGESVAKFASALRFAHVSPEPSSAAPGTSDHGQLSAVDFVVIKDGKVIAGTKTADIGPIWKAGGWERKLIDATAGTKLVGPLKTPYEPWHWWLG